MKKTKLILCTLVAAMMLMGAGYAYWTDTLTINNTVSTGNLEVKISHIESRDYDNLKSSNAFTDDEKDEDYVNGLGESSSIKILNSGKRLEFKNENLYPGSGFWLNFKIKNTGTVPVKLKDITYQITKNGTDKEKEKDIKDDFRYTIGKIVKTTISGLNDGSNISFKNEVLNEDNIETESFIEFIEELENKLKFDDNSVIVLNPGEIIWIGNQKEGKETLTAGYDIYLKEGTEVDNSTQNANFNFTLQFNFTQHNDPNN